MLAKNLFQVVVENSTDVLTGEQGSLIIRAGDWAQIWSSRADVVAARLVLDEHREQSLQPMLHDHHVVVEVQLSTRFNPRFDYLLVEHKRTANPRLRGDSVKESYELLAGTMPPWAAFAPAWFSWVRNDEVALSAIEFIVSRVPDAFAPIYHAVMQEQKHLKAEAWLEVARVCFASAGKKVDKEKLLGNKSQTSVLAMPMKIAQRLGGWKPPVEPPVFQAARRSRRLLVAAPGNYRHLPCARPGEESGGELSCCEESGGEVSCCGEKSGGQVPCSKPCETAA